MIKKIFTIAIFTGAGQLFIIFSLKYISQHSSQEQVKAIGQIDSPVLFINRFRAESSGRFSEKVSGFFNLINC